MMSTRDERQGLFFYLERPLDEADPKEKMKWAFKVQKSCVKVVEVLS